MDVIDTAPWETRASGLAAELAAGGVLLDPAWREAFVSTPGMCSCRGSSTATWCGGRVIRAGWTRSMPTSHWLRRPDLPAAGDSQLVVQQADGHGGDAGQARR